VLVRAARPSEESSAGAARVALVLYGFATTPPWRLVLHAAAAVRDRAGPGGKSSAEIFRRARRQSREVILHLPLEPSTIRGQSGPGTLL